MSDLEHAYFDGDTYDHDHDQTRLSTALAAVRQILGRKQRWWTLGELTEEVSHCVGRPVSEAGVSARLRDLRKERFGSHDIERQRVEESGVWVYRLNPPRAAVATSTVQAGEGVEPRTRRNPLRRPRLDVENVGKRSMPLTCPRCGWPCTVLVTPYYQSPWTAHGGICSQCCHEAQEHFDKVGWPERPSPPDEAS